MKAILKRELNKWQFVCHYQGNYATYDGRVFRFGLINFQRFPEIGESFSKKHYKGFLFEFRFRHPLSKLRKYLESKGY